MIIPKIEEFEPKLNKFILDYWRYMQRLYPNVKNLKVARFIDEQAEELYALQILYCAVAVQEKILKEKIERLFQQQEEERIYGAVKKDDEI